MAAKVLSVRQVEDKKFNELKGLPEWILESFGPIDDAVKAFFYGRSNHGKTSVLMNFLAGLLESGKNGRALYWSLEEGHRQSMQKALKRYLPSEKYSGLLSVASSELTPKDLRERLDRRNSERIIVTDSVQYTLKIFKMTYADWVQLMADYPDRIWIFISHGKSEDLPKGSVADDLLFDSDVKCYVEGLLAFPKSRIGGRKPIVIWEEGARKYWKDKYYEKAEIEPPKKEKKSKTEKTNSPKNEESTNDSTGISGRDRNHIQPGGDTGNDGLPEGSNDGGADTMAENLRSDSLQNDPIQTTG